MIGRFLALTAGLSLLVLIFARSSDAGSTNEKDALVPLSPVAQKGSSSMSDWNAGTHTLAREFDGHFYANTNVNGTRLRMLGDTGASMIALTGSDAIAAGIRWA